MGNYYERSPKGERGSKHFRRYAEHTFARVLSLCLSLRSSINSLCTTPSIFLSRSSLPELSSHFLGLSAPLFPLSLCSPALALSLASSFAFPPPSHHVLDLHEQLDISKFPSSILYLNQESPNLGPRNGSTHQASAAELHRAFQQGDTGVQGPI